jgi:hypothetical protein
MALESAEAYYEYGNALLMQEEDNPSKGLLSNVDDDENAEAEEEDENAALHTESGGNNENEETEEENGEVEVTEDDLQVAWEVLDVSPAFVRRCILKVSTVLLGCKGHIGKRAR